MQVTATPFLRGQALSRCVFVVGFLLVHVEVWMSLTSIMITDNLSSPNIAISRLDHNRHKNDKKY